jgi:hypothetical protein
MIKLLMLMIIIMLLYNLMVYVYTCVTITYHEPKVNPPVFLGGRGAHILHGERGRRAGTFY